MYLFTLSTFSSLWRISYYSEERAMRAPSWVERSDFSRLILSNSWWTRFNLRIKLALSCYKWAICSLTWSGTDLRGSLEFCGIEPRLKLETAWELGSLSPTLDIPGIPTLADWGLPPWGFRIVALSMLGEAELLNTSCLLLLYSSSSSPREFLICEFPRVSDPTPPLFLCRRGEPPLVEGPKLILD